MQRKDRRSRKRRKENVGRRHANNMDFNGHDRRNEMDRRAERDRRLFDEWSE